MYTYQVLQTILFTSFQIRYFAIVLQLTKKSSKETGCFAQSHKAKKYARTRI